MADPWRCVKCGFLVYATDPRGYPTVGAPECKHETRMGNLCEACYALWWTVSTQDYWRKLQADYEARFRPRE